MRLVHVVSALLVLWTASPVHSEPIAPFVIAGDSPLDFSPAMFGGAVAAYGSFVFISGSGVNSDTGAPENVLAAFDLRDGSEAWRAVIGGRVGPAAAFAPTQGVAVGTGVACSAGPTLNLQLLLSCFRATTGRLLWERELDLPGAVRFVEMQIAHGTLVLAVQVAVIEPGVGGVFRNLVLTFSARDGS